MRILHTADWHVGRTIRGRSRANEHQAVLREIAEIAARESVDLVLVAGDQFDTAAPGPDAERIVYRALLDLVDTGAQVVLVAGNHDNPGRLAAVAPLLETSRVHCGARLARPEGGGVVDVQAGGEVARIALVPFLSQRGIVRADDLLALDADQHGQRYEARCRQIIARLCAAFAPDTVNLLVAHLMVAGGTAGGGERSAHTIFDYCLSPTVFPPDAHYVALGHLHRAQQVPAAAPAWYAGSPLQLDFGEEQQTKAVLLVDASPGQPAEVRAVELRSGRGLRTLRGSLDDLESLAGTTGDDHLRVVVRGQARAGLAEQVREWYPEAVDVIVESPELAPAEGGATARLGRSPVELFGEYLRDRGAEDERVAALFAELLDAAAAGEVTDAPGAA
jgi:DNA repair protein SbcD/Mre11